MVSLSNTVVAIESSLTRYFVVDKLETMVGVSLSNQHLSACSRR